MTRELAVLVMAGSAVLVLGLVAWGWWIRARRDRGFVAPFAELPAGAVEGPPAPAFYVATTRHDEPLERLAIRGLTFRSRADVTPSDAGIALDLTGKPRIVIPASDIVGVDQATVAIDRVVEPDGLVRVAWRIDPDTIVDTYFRPEQTSARSLSYAIRRSVPDVTPRTPSGEES